MRFLGIRFCGPEYAFCSRMRILLALLQNARQLGPVGRYHTVFHRGSLDHNRHLIGVAGYERLAPLELRYAPYLRAGELERVLYVLGFVRLKVEDDFVFRVIHDSAAVFPVVQAEEVRKVLAGRYRAAAESSYQLKNAQAKLRSVAIGGSADQLPNLVDVYRLALGSVGHYLVPYKIQRDHHADGEELSF